ncbi:helicase associated domain-containing protein [Streptomyces lavendulae]|uniref:helicase associated domain-containing protein n=1 Tax=Streptomyces lavendulae TaxID=1914 RepID=UPI003D7F6035
MNAPRKCPQFPRNQKRIMQPSPLIGKAPADGEDENRLLLHCAAPRGPALIAQWISYRVSNAERQDWRRGIEAAFRCREREGHLQVPYEHTEGPCPRGRWLSEQRHTCRTGTMPGERAAELEGLGVVWDTADHAFDQSLAAARAYHRPHGTLAPDRRGLEPRSAGVDGGLAAALRLPHPALGGRRPPEGRHRRGDPALRGHRPVARHPTTGVEPAEHRTAGPARCARDHPSAGRTNPPGTRDDPRPSGPRKPSTKA